MIWFYILHGSYVEPELWWGEGWGDRREGREARRKSDSGFNKDAATKAMNSGQSQAGFWRQDW